jgi:hypothetical protein
MANLDAASTEQAAVAEGIAATHLALRGILDAVAGRPASDEARAAVEHVQLIGERLGDNGSRVVMVAVAAIATSQHVSTPSQVYELLRRTATHILFGKNPIDLATLLPVYAKLMVKRDAAQAPEAPLDPTSTADGADAVEFSAFGSPHDLASWSNG